MDSDIVFIGKKPLMTYVLAVLTHVNSGHDLVKLKARGVMISKAVDVSQVIKRKFSKDLNIGRIDIGTEEITSDDGKKRNVSFISIEMKR
ncbi:MAG: DNA-binding protein Alba [Candidatus Parvarchaeota archaeon]|nr:DNA-binding protein Alba [Candidatus Parvarchaeota archaeon]